MIESLAISGSHIGMNDGVLAATDTDSRNAGMDQYWPRIKPMLSVSVWFRVNAVTFWHGKLFMARWCGNYQLTTKKSCKDSITGPFLWNWKIMNKKACILFIVLTVHMWRTSDHYNSHLDINWQIKMSKWQYKICCHKNSWKDNELETQMYSFIGEGEIQKLLFSL